jgi:hypothetical protein
MLWDGSRDEIDDDARFGILQDEVMTDDAVGELRGESWKAEQQGRGNGGEREIFGIIAIDGEAPTGHGVTLADGLAGVEGGGTAESIEDDALEFGEAGGAEHVTGFGVGASLTDLAGEGFAAGDDFAALSGGAKFGDCIVECEVLFEALLEVAKYGGYGGR